MKFKPLLFILLFSLLGCDSKTGITVKIQSSVLANDTLYFKELYTDKPLAKIALSEKMKEFDFNASSPTIGVISAKDETIGNYLFVLTPGETINICIDSLGIRTNDDLADSLLNYLWKSNNEVVGRVFSLGSTNEVISLFDSLALRRKEIIASKKHMLTVQEFELLNFQNEARIYSFLFYYGRMMKEFTPDHSYFSFIDKIDNNLDWNKTLPNNLLYKYEIQYLKSAESIDDISSFLDFIETQTVNKDLSAFLKMYYLAEVIESPSYWKRHTQLFNTKNLHQILEKEKLNPYYALTQRASNAFYTSQKGIRAYDFTAISADNKQIKLSDFKGKLIFIDVWATWCGPCLSQKPNVLKLAERYKNNPDVVFLMVSVDSSKDKWKKYLSKRDFNPYVQELFIEDGMYSEFGNMYNVKSIPKYILIDKDSKIINSNLDEPSPNIEKMISEHLKEV
jgi:thiol-disulfide isomerase/thioredoxin